MQNLVNDDNNKNKTNSNDNNSMSPQVQLHQVQPPMRHIHQPYQQHRSLPQLNQLQNWSQQQPGDKSPKNEANVEQINKPPSPTNISLESSSIKSNAGKGLRSTSSSASSFSSTMKNANINPNNNATFKPYHQIKRGSGVDIKRPTPEVAQQLRFPWKLHLLLERCEYEHQQKLASAAAEGANPGRIPDMPISWLPCGKAFKVHDKERFVKEVMPSFFGTQSFKTFQRNLNLWGFTRVSKGPQKDVCSHPLFLKGFPAVCQSMKRIVLKGTGRGNRAPRGGVDVSSVQAVVAAAAMQQAQQQQAAQQQAAIGFSQGTSSIIGAFSQVPPHVQAQQVLQQQQIQAQHKKESDVFNRLSPQPNTMSHINLQNQQQAQVSQNQQQQQQFLIENGSIHAAPMPSQQKLVVLPSATNPNALSSATTTVMWPNNQRQQQMQSQQAYESTNVNATLQKSLQQLSTIIQQLNGCNAMATAAVNNNAVNSNINNTTHFQQQQLAPTPLPTVIQQQQQQSVMIQQPQQQSATSNLPNAVVTPSPMSTQDLVALLLQRNLQQQVCQVQAVAPQQSQAPIQLQVPSSLYPSGPFSTPQPAAPALRQQPVAVNSGANLFAANATNFAQQQQQQQQQGTNMMGNSVNTANIFSQQQQQTTPASPTPTSSQHHQQNQLLQMLLQQNGWATTAAPI